MGRRLNTLTVVIMIFSFLIVLGGCENQVFDTIAAAILHPELLDLPVPGVITVNPSEIAGEFSIDWSAATDLSTQQADLEYKAVYSTSNNIGSFNNANTNGTIALDWVTDTYTATITGLTDGVPIYVNVMVRDSDSNGVIYNVSQGPPIIEVSEITYSSKIINHNFSPEYIYGTDTPFEGYIEFTIQIFNKGFGNQYLLSSISANDIASNPNNFAIPTQPTMEAIAPNTTREFILKLDNLSMFTTYYCAIDMATNDLAVIRGSGSHSFNVYVEIWC